MESNEIKLTEEQIREAQILAEGKRPNNQEQNESKLRKLSKTIDIISVVLLVIGICVGLFLGADYESIVLLIVTILSSFLLFISVKTTAAFLNVFCDNAKNLREIAKK